MKRLLSALVHDYFLITFIHIRAADPVVHRRVVRAILNPKQRGLMLVEGKLLPPDSMALSRN